MNIYTWLPLEDTLLNINFQHIKALIKPFPMISLGTSPDFIYEYFYVLNIEIVKTKCGDQS